jgi:hypothetical protein
MGEWPPDQQLVIDAPDKPVGRDKTSKIFFWVVPGNAAGKWSWQLPQAGKQAAFELNVTQNFQRIAGTMSAGGKSWPIENARLRGEDISFAVKDKVTAVSYEFTGHINGSVLNGTVRVAGPASQGQLEWDATRTEIGVPAHTLLKKPDLREFQLFGAQPVR